MVADHTKHVLVVDDDPDMVKSLEIYLRLSGHVVRCAYGGRNALEQIEQECPSAILLDIMMPDMNGYDVCRHLRECIGDRETPVIMLTALCGDEARTEALDAGANEFLTKPRDFHDILVTVEQYTS
jgi:DNA-binding response OmpR family regulator